MKHRAETLPIWRDATRLLLEVEQATLARYHQYVLGSDLRRQSMNICRWVTRAAHAEGAGTREAGLAWSIAKAERLLLRQVCGDKAAQKTSKSVRDAG